MNKCFECEKTEDLQEHHVVPKSRGGTKTVTLCYECHMKAHGRTGKGLNHKRLTKEGLAEAKARGVKLGTHNPKVLKAHYDKGLKNVKRMFPHIQEARKQGYTSLGQIRKFLNENNIKTPRGKKWRRGNIHALIKRIDKAHESGMLKMEEK